MGSASRLSLEARRDNADVIALFIMKARLLE